MRTVAATRQTPRPDLTSAPKALEWAVYIREHKIKLSASARSLALLLITLGQGQHISLSITGMADSTGMSRNTIKAALKELHDHGLITVKDTGRNQTTIYRLTLPRWSTTDHLGGQPLTTKVVNQGPPGGQSLTTTSREDEEVDEQLHQHADDDVAVATPPGDNREGPTARSTSARATGASSASTKCRPVKEYVADLEVCRDELARRLCVDPGSITVKPLAKQLRNLDIEHDETAMWSEILDMCPEDDTVWEMSASKDNPIGFLKFALEQRLEGNDVTQFYRRPAAEQPVVEIDARVLADKVADRVLAGETIHYFQYFDFGVSKDALIEAIKLLESDDRFNVSDYASGWRVYPRSAR